MYSVQLLSKNTKGDIVPELGSEGTRDLDGRYGYSRADNEAMDYYLKIKHVKSYLLGYRLLKNGVKIRDFIF